MTCRRLLVEALDIHPGELVLDAAGGSGNATIAAARRFAQVIGLDFASDMLVDAARRAAAGADGSGLPAGRPAVRSASSSGSCHVTSRPLRAWRPRPRGAIRDAHRHRLEPVAEHLIPPGRARRRRGVRLSRRVARPRRRAQRQTTETRSAAHPSPWPPRAAKACCQTHCSPAAITHLWWRLPPPCRSASSRHSSS